MYRTPRTSVIDRHTLIELDGDYTDYEIGHLLRKAYENHKAPHEYDDIKKYIRDMVIGKHNSVYYQGGVPTPLASAAVLMPVNTLGGVCGGQINNTSYTNACYYAIFPNCPSLAGGWNGKQTPLVNYNNGMAALWTPYYSNSSWESPANGYAYYCPSSGTFTIAPSGYDYWPLNITPKYLYAPYITSTNPLTLSTYYYWTYPLSWSAATYNYVLFTWYCYMQWNVFLFYSTGTFNLNPGTAYITMWQWTYT